MTGEGVEPRRCPTLRAMAGALRGGLVPGWRRGKTVTLARAGVILAMYAVWIGQIALTHDAPSGRNPWEYYVERTLWYGGPVLAYAFTLGLLVDHLVARWGQVATLGAHAFGILLFMPAMLTIATSDPEWAYEEPLQALGVLVIWPIQLGIEAMRGYLLTWLVPNSYPRQYSVLKAIARFVRHPILGLQGYLEGGEDVDAEWPSRENGTDWFWQD